MTVAGAQGASGTESEFSGGTDVGTLCCRDKVVDDVAAVVAVEIVEGTNP